MRQRLYRIVLIGPALLLALTNAALSQASNGDPLPRRGTLGAAIMMNNDAVTVSAVLPGSPSAVNDVQKGDVVLTVDGERITSVPQFLQKLRRPAGQSVALGLIRGSQALTKKITLTEFPKEQDPQVQTLYGSVSIDGSLRRMLVTVPQGARGQRPAVFFVGGIGCYSIDVANPNDGYRNLAHALSRQGFVTARLEKSGVGDSQGPPCQTVDFATESHSYSTALEAFTKDPHVDPKRLYILGHSIGTIIAPRLALDEHAAGVIVVAAVARNWFEYELINLRRQLNLNGTKPEDVDPEMQLKEWCMHRTLIDKQSDSDVIKARPDCKRAIPYPVTIAYFQQVADLNILAPWTKLNVPVLTIYGGADFITDEADHRLIVATVNALHPKTASFALINNMDHYLWVMPSQGASFANASQSKEGRYNVALSETVVGWLCAREACRTKS